MAKRQQLVHSYFRTRSLFWHNLYQATGVFEVIHQERLGAIVNLVEKVTPRGSRVLDIGCGAGLVSALLAKRGYAVDAADPLPEMIELTREGATAANLERRVECLRADIQHLPFSDNSFEVCVAAGVLPWVESSERAVKEMRRVVKFGRHLILTTDNRWGLCWILDPFTNPVLKRFRDQAFGAFRKLDWPTRHLSVEFMSGTRFRDLLHSNGLRVLEHRTLGFGPFSFFRQEILSHAVGLRLHQRLQRLADSQMPLLRSLGAQHIWLAEKIT